MLSTLRSLANAILGKVPGKPDRLDTATRMAMDADFSDRGERAPTLREPFRKVDQIEELRRILGEQRDAAKGASNPSANVGNGRRAHLQGSFREGPESAPIAVIPMGARNRLHRPKETFPAAFYATIKGLSN